MDYILVILENSIYFNNLKSTFCLADMSHCEYRLLVQLNGLKFHLYNRTELYCQLEKYFGLENILLPEKKKDKTDKKIKTDNKDPTDMSFWNAWRDLIPVIKFQLEMVSVQLCKEFQIM